MTNPGPMCVIPRSVAEQLRQLLPAQTDAMVMSQLGISWTTWMKIRSGQAIRVSTARRMLERIARTNRLTSELFSVFEFLPTPRHEIEADAPAHF